jgi:PilZ domain
MTDQNNPNSPGVSDDFIVVERSKHRSVVGMSGRYMLGTVGNAHGKSREFPCRIVRMSAQAMTLSGPVTGSKGDWVSAHFERLGRFEGPVLKTLHRSLVMKIVATNEDRLKFADKIAWITDNQKRDARRFERLVPAYPFSTLSLPGGQALPCFVIDYSMGGAAITADETPAIGTVLKIGRVEGRVLRHFRGGFAVVFPVLQDFQIKDGRVVQFSAPDGSE